MEEGTILSGTLLLCLDTGIESVAKCDELGFVGGESHITPRREAIEPCNDGLRFGVRCNALDSKIDSQVTGSLEVSIIRRFIGFDFDGNLTPHIFQVREEA